ncbi:hypothetical protein [Streptomyces sp. NPDC002324]
MSRRTLTTLTLMSAAALLSTTGCSSNGDTETQKQRSVRTAGPTPAKATPAKGTSAADANENENENDANAGHGGESVAHAPDLDMADRVVLRQNGTRGNAALEFGKAEKGDGEAVTIGVRCEGKGGMNVVIRSLATSFPLTCVDGEVSEIYNQFALDGANRAGVVSVTADPGVRWSLSIGRGEPTEQDLSD